jgi:hypothetical protein
MSRTQEELFEELLTIRNAMESKRYAAPEMQRTHDERIEQALARVDLWPPS